MHARVQHGRQDLRGRDPSTRSPAGDAVQAYGEGGAHDRGRQGRADPTAVRQDQETLLAADLLLGQPGVLAVADLGRQAVDGLTASQGPVHHGPAGRDPGTRPVVQLHPRAVDHGQQILDRQRVRTAVPTRRAATASGSRLRPAASWPQVPHLVRTPRTFAARSRSSPGASVPPHRSLSCRASRAHAVAR